MRYVQLRAFHHVAVSGGFSNAAAELNLTQPAVSDQVRRLEAEYDLRLFDRRRRQVTLTEDGERLLAITRRMFESEGQAAEFLSESRALRAGALCIHVDAVHHLTPILNRYRSLYPGIRITVRTGNSQTILEKLRTYEADIGVLGEVPDDASFEVLRLNATPIVAFVARGNPLARRGSLGFRDLESRALVLREEGSKTRTKLVAAAEAAGVTLAPSIEAEGREAVRGIVAAGDGVGFVSMAEFGEDPRLVPIPIRPDSNLLMEESLVCMRERRNGKRVRALFELAQDMDV